MIKGTSESNYLRCCTTVLIVVLRRRKTRFLSHTVLNNEASTERNQTHEPARTTSKKQKTKNLPREQSVRPYHIACLSAMPLLLPAASRPPTRTGRLCSPSTTAIEYRDTLMHKRSIERAVRRRWRCCVAYDSVGQQQQYYLSVLILILLIIVSIGSESNHFKRISQRYQRRCAILAVQRVYTLHRSERGTSGISYHNRV